MEEKKARDRQDDAADRQESGQAAESEQAAVQESAVHSPAENGQPGGPAGVTARETTGETTGGAASQTNRPANPAPEIRDETGVIAAGTRIVGDILTQGHLMIYGEVEGDITANGDITVAGMVHGDISCNNLQALGFRGQANITARGSVSVDAASCLEGKVQCASLTVDGVIRGDIEAADDISLFRNGNITGNIRAKRLGIEPGAQLQGSVTVVR